MPALELTSGPDYSRGSACSSLGTNNAGKTMRIPMHRFKYTKLTREQIGTKLKAVEGTGPKSASAFSNVLTGKSLKIITEDGPALEYKFAANRRLTLVENGKQSSAGYGELTLNDIVFFSHLIPGEQKGYNVYIDQKTNLATVFEVWLSSGRKEGGGRSPEYALDDREVQRQIHFGYVDTGKPAPAKLHHYTNRMTGKGIHWTLDNGIETTELYVSVANTYFIDHTRNIDDLGYVATSDYALADDRTIFYNRTECEFSGIHTTFVADLYAVKQVGVRSGFNDKDELEYYMFKGEGKNVGQIAYLENFDDHGLRPIFMPAAAQAAAAAPAAPAKGARYSYRPVRTFTHMTDEEMHAAALVRTAAFGVVSGTGAAAPPAAAPAGGAPLPPAGAGNNLPFSDLLVGKEFTLRYDNGGPVRDYRIKSTTKLQYRDQKDNKWRDAEYRAYEGDDNLAWFAHILEDSKPRACTMVALDLSNGLVTSIESHLGTEYYGNETTYLPIFGVCEMAGLEAPLYVRHELTDELVGNCFSWSYNDQTTSMHVYGSPHSMSWVIFTGAQQMGAEWCSPCIFVKLRPGVYIFCQNEEACNGNQMTELLNTKASHDCGFTFNGGPVNGNRGGASLGTTGAIGRHIGKFDILPYFGPKRRA